jgi:hypothetical protein
MHIVCIRFACKNMKASPLSTRFVTDGAELLEGTT